jgi:hypothetical protein
VLLLIDGLLRRHMPGRRICRRACRSWFRFSRVWESGGAHLCIARPWDDPARVFRVLRQLVQKLDRPVEESEVEFLMISVQTRHSGANDNPPPRSRHRNLHAPPAYLPTRPPACSTYCCPSDDEVLATSSAVPFHVRDGWRDVIDVSIIGGTCLAHPPDGNLGVEWRHR